MKRIIIFIGLKIAELSGVIIAYLLFSLLGFFLMDLFDNTSSSCWYNFIHFVFGICVSFLTVSLLIGLYFAITEWIPYWIESNWDWAKRLSKRK